ncbi:hypothetical protein YK56LOC_60790 [Caballeronia sp. HLA56]
MTDETAAARAETASEREADLGELRGFAGAGFAAHDHDLIPFDRARDLLATGGDGKCLGKGDRRDGVGGDGAPLAARWAYVVLPRGLNCGDFALLLGAWFAGSRRARLTW